MRSISQAIVAAAAWGAMGCSDGSRAAPDGAAPDAGPVEASGPVCEAVAPARCFYVAPDGDDSAAGTIDAPFKTFRPPISAANAGDFIYARGGVYGDANTMIYTSTYDGSDQYAMFAIRDYDGYPAHTQSPYQVNSGTAQAPITIKAYPGETAKLTSPTAAFIDSKAYWVIDGFDIDGSRSGNGVLFLTGGGGFGTETHDITIQNCNLHDYVVNGSALDNVGVIRINRADQSGAYNVFIRHNHISMVSEAAAPGVWSGLADAYHIGAVTVLSAQCYVGYSAGGTGYLEITDNEIDHVPTVLFLKNPMAGPLEVHGNTIHDADGMGLLDAANLHFNHNLVYSVPGGFYEVGQPEPDPANSPQMASITGQNAVIQSNTFVGLVDLMNIAAGTGHTITQNVFFGFPNTVTGASWNTGVGYLTKMSAPPDPVDPASSILQQVHSDQNCFITPSSDAIFVSRYWTDGTPLEYDGFQTGQSLYHFDPSSKLVVQPDATKIFVNPAAHDYTLLDSSLCPGMGK